MNPFGHTGTTRLNCSNAAACTAAATLAIPASLPISTTNTDTVSVADRFDGPASIAGGEIAPRNALQGLPLHRIDLRVSKDVNLPNGIRLTGIAEVFNITNHANFGAYNGQINSTTFGQPRQSLLNAYQPRVMQLAFKVSF